MIHQPPEGREALIAYIVGLSVACPVQQDNPPGCPFNSIRCKALQDRYNWVKSQSTEQLKELARHHCTCLEEKECLQSSP